jgi:hypothetical protein
MVRTARLRLLKQLAAIACAAWLATASSATASVTIGQTEPTNDFCSPGYDWVQPTVTSGDAYVVPATVATGAITSWSSQANASGGVMTLKVFRHVAGLTYMAVGHDVPRTLTPGVLNTFTGISIPVKAGDVLGLHDGAGMPACVFDVLGDAVFFRFADLADSQSGDFEANTDTRLNVTAVVRPVNTFTLGTTTRNKKKGTATLTVNVPNPGELTGSGKGVKVAGVVRISNTVTAPGNVKLTINAKGKKKTTLNETGKVKLNVAVTYTPTNGDPSTQSAKVNLKKNL